MKQYILSNTQKFEYFFLHKEISNIIYLHDEEDNERLDHVVFLEKKDGDVTGIFIRGMNPFISTNRIFDLDDFNLFASYDELTEHKDNIALKIERIGLFFSAEYNELLGLYLSDADDSTSLFILFLHDQIEVKKGCNKSDAAKIISDRYSNNGFVTYEKKSEEGWRQIKVENCYPEYVTRNVMYSLAEKLHLPEPGEFTQDWEYEVADSSRVDEFISFYENEQLDGDEKFALMIIVISSFNDVLSQKGMEAAIWERIKRNLVMDRHIHMNTILYWADIEAELEDSWAIAPYMREVLSLVTQTSPIHPADQNK